VRRRSFDNAALLDQIAKLKDGKITLSDARSACPAWRANSAAGKPSSPR
jgi:hypothetical protein